jgi:hypothetical protein
MDGIGKKIMSDQEREERFQKALAELKDAAIVSSALEARHERMMKNHAELLDKHSLWLAQQDAAIARHAAWLAEHEAAHARIDKKLEDITLKLDEATDKLNGLIGYWNGRHERPQ